MTTTEEIDKYIKEVGKGSVRDALNIALFTIKKQKEEIKSLKDELRIAEEDNIFDIAE